MITSLGEPSAQKVSKPVGRWVTDLALRVAVNRDTVGVQSACELNARTTRNIPIHREIETLEGFGAERHIIGEEEGRLLQFATSGGSSLVCLGRAAPLITIPQHVLARSMTCERGSSRVDADHR